MKKIIVIVGLPGSGKSLAAEIIKKMFNADSFKSGDIIRDEIKRRGLKYTPENDSIAAHWFNVNGREKLLSRRLWGKVKKSKKDLIVLDGFRAPEQFKYLRETYKGKPVIIFIKSSFKVRAERELERKRFGKQENKEYLRHRDKLEKSHGLMETIKKADYTIDNSKLTKKQLESRVVKLMEKITKA
ncbi:MAG: AAA family ATPase [Candidatus Aenigmatarchaeota archaeon]